jgi:TrmH family RNA methyltransferase
MLSKNRIKFLKSLHQKKYRDESSLFITEGEKIVNELLAFNPSLIDCIYHTKEFQFENIQHVNSEEISNSELSQISCLKNPNKVVAICKMWKNEDNSNSDFYIALDEIQDPGNMGTIIRLADWFNVKTIVCSANSADVFNPKVVQASMGSLFRVNVIYQDLNEFITSKKLPVYGAFLEGVSVYSKKMYPKGILILGNEGKGISQEIEALVTEKIKIPRFGQAESLNVSIATGILLSEFFRNEG